MRSSCSTASLRGFTSSYLSLGLSTHPTRYGWLHCPRFVGGRPQSPLFGCFPDALQTKGLRQTLVRPSVTRPREEPSGSVYHTIRLCVPHLVRGVISEKNVATPQNCLSFTVGWRGVGLNTKDDRLTTWSTSRPLLGKAHRLRKVVTRGSSAPRDPLLYALCSPRLDLRLLLRQATSRTHFLSR